MPDPDALENSFKYLLNEMHHLLVVLDKDFKIQKVNSKFTKVVGRRVEDIIGKEWVGTFIPESKADPVRQALRAVIDNKYLMKSESPLLCASTKKVLIEWDNSPVLSNDECIGIICFGVDVSGRSEIEELLRISEEKSRLRAELLEKQNRDLEERKLAMIRLLEEEKKLEESLQIEKASVEKKVKERTYELSEQRAQLMAAINSVPHGFIVTDKDNRFVITNDKLDDIFETNTNTWDLIALQALLGESIPLTEKLNYCRANREPLFIRDVEIRGKILQIYMSPIFIGQISNVIIGSLILITDVTEEKIVERSKDEFLSIASHELRTPITAIRGNVDLIRHYYADKISDRDFTEMLSDISESSTRLIELVNEFLNTSRLEQGKIHFEQSLIDITSLAQSVVDELQAVAQEKNLSLKLKQFEGSLPLIKGDANRIKEVLINLLSNAINYTDKGSVEVKFDLDSSSVKLIVTDTGRGIDEKDQKYLFRKFHQANVNLYTRDASHSTGLGLYISRLIAEGLHGRIYLESSKVGEGSTFVFSLPLEK